MSLFQKATKKQAYLRLALEGPAGFGKTMTALLTGARIAERVGGRMAYVDTEAGSAAKYADRFDFDTAEMGPPFHPDRVVEAISGAAEAGYSVIVLDSLSHFWTGQGGMLELVDQIARTKYRGDSHRAWADGGEIQQRLIDAILRTPIHIVACMRTKKDYVRETHVDEQGRERTRIRPAGAKTVQRDEFDYEFDLVCRFDQPTIMAVLKSRCADLPPETMIEKPGADFADTLIDWLSDGAEMPVVDRSRLDAALARLAELDEVTDYPAALDKASHKDHGRSLALLTQTEIDGYADRMESHAAKLEEALRPTDGGQGSGEGPSGPPRPPADDATGTGTASSAGSSSSSSPDNGSDGTPTGAGEGSDGEAATSAADPDPSDEPQQETMFAAPTGARGSRKAKGGE